MKPDFLDREKVLDAERDFAFTILPRDIKKGKRKNIYDCAAALAIKRENSNVAAVAIQKTVAHIKFKDDTIERYIIPKNLELEAMVFDRDGKFAPGDYKLNCPAFSQTLDEIAKSSRRQNEYVKNGTVKPNKQPIRKTPNVR